MRTGNHSRNGFAFVTAPGLEPGDRGVRSAFDVTPTILDLLGRRARSSIAGTSLLDSQRGTDAGTGAEGAFHTGAGTVRP
jgi:hypothetical protein